MVMGFIVAALVLIFTNTLIFNSLIDELNDVGKPIRILLFIPPFSIIAAFIIVILMFFTFIIDSFKQI
jgi:hypothetical protein